MGRGERWPAKFHDASSGIEPAEVFSLISDYIEFQRPRTNQAYVSLQDIPQLRERFFLWFVIYVRGEGDFTSRTSPSYRLFFVPRSFAR